MRPSIQDVRARLAGLERALFDIICAAGLIGHRLPYWRSKLSLVCGVRDPRTRVLRRAATVLRRLPDTPSSSDWSRASARVSRLLADALARKPLPKKWRALRILLGRAPAALAPNCTVPTHAALNAAWKTVLRTYGHLFPSQCARLGRLSWLRDEDLAVLRVESQAGAPTARDASGRRPGPMGRRLAVDSRLTRLVGAALGQKLQPGYEAKYVYYTKRGDFFWPHPDDPFYPVTVLVCLEHQRPAARARPSAFLAYRPAGTMRRYELRPGEAVAMQSQGLVHGREPMAAGERVTLLSIAFASKGRAAQ